MPERKTRRRVARHDTMLVTAEPAKREGIDPAMAAFVAFLAQDVVAAPQHIRALDSKLAKRIDRLTQGVETDRAEELADEVDL